MMTFVDQESEILNTPSQLVTTFDQALRENIRKIREEHRIGSGVGLAAPQVGINQRIAVIGFEPTEAQLKKNPDIIRIEEVVLINPKIVWHSGDQKVEKEGCLSIKDSSFDVPRYQKIHVEFQDENGAKKKLKARGYFARVLQHEIDHLNGLTIKRFEK